MPSVIIGQPEEPEKQDRPAFYVHKNLICYLETRPDGVWVLGADPKSDKIIFEKHCAHAGEAMGYVQAKKAYFDKAYGQKEGEHGNGEERPE